MYKPWVYIAGPITQGDTCSHVREAMAVWKWLHDSGIHPIAPQWSVLQAMAYPIGYEQWIAHDFETIRKCDAVLRILPDLPSAGAEREIEFANSIGVPTFARVDDLLAHFGKAAA